MITVLSQAFIEGYLPTIKVCEAIGESVLLDLDIRVLYLNYYTGKGVQGSDFVLTFDKTITNPEDFYIGIIGAAYKAENVDVKSPFITQEKKTITVDCGNNPNFVPKGVRSQSRTKYTLTIALQKRWPLLE